MADMDTFIATVDEYIDDENRIVTYKWLSQQLAVSVNKSREILQKYVESCEKQNQQIEIIYTLIGRNSKGLSVKVIQKSDLESAKSDLDKVISTSLYSVQKAKLSDASTLYAADYDTDHKNLYEKSKLGGIEYKGAKKFSKDELKKLTKPQDGAKDTISGLEAQFAKPPSKPQPKFNFFGKTKSPEKTDKAKNTSSKVLEQTTAKPAPQNAINTKPSPPQKTQKKGVAGFLTKGKTDPFAQTKMKVKAAKEDPKDDVEPSSNEAHDKSEMEKKSNETKTDAGKPKESTDKGPKVAKKLKNITNNGKEAKKSSRKRIIEDDDLKIDDFSDDGDFVDETADKKSANKRKKSSETSKKRKSESHNSEKPGKKRKRIQCISSSSEEEDEVEAEEEEMDVIPPSPPPPKKTQFEESSPKKDEADKTVRSKKKVLQTKTFLDEDGFMVTEKSYELVECNEPETVAKGNTSEVEPKEIKQPDTKSPPKKTLSISTAAKPKKQTKQASITGFFKKK